MPPVEPPPKKAREHPTPTNVPPNTDAKITEISEYCEALRLKIPPKISGFKSLEKRLTPKGYIRVEISVFMLNAFPKNIIPSTKADQANKLIKTSTVIYLLLIIFSMIIAIPEIPPTTRL